MQRKVKNNFGSVELGSLVLVLDSISIYKKCMNHIQTNILWGKYEKEGEKRGDANCSPCLRGTKTIPRPPN